VNIHSSDSQSECSKSLPYAVRTILRLFAALLQSANRRQGAWGNRLLSSQCEAWRTKARRKKGAASVGACVHAVLCLPPLSVSRLCVFSGF